MRVKRKKLGDIANEAAAESPTPQGAAGPAGVPGAAGAPGAVRVMSPEESALLVKRVTVGLKMIGRAPVRMFGLEPALTVEEEDDFAASALPVLNAYEPPPWVQKHLPLILLGTTLFFIYWPRFEDKAERMRLARAKSREAHHHRNDGPREDVSRAPENTEPSEAFGM